MSASTVLPSFCLPNGLTVFGLTENDTLTVYRDIFDDDCYRQNGVTIKDGDCILDVGANTGLFILFLNKIGVQVRVFAFEPAPATFAVLSRNVETYNKLPVQLFNVGLSREAGQATFTYYPRFSNASTLYPDESPEGALRGRQYIIDQIPTVRWPWRTMLQLIPRPIKHLIAERMRRYYLKKETVTCELWNLSDFLKKHNIAQVDLLKMDAEQSEQHILAGLAEEDWPKIRQIVVEVHGGGGATRALVELLNQRGFRTAVDPNPAMPTLALVYGVRLVQAALAPADQALSDWNIYYQMLSSGRLKEFGGEFIVVHKGAIIAHGADSDELRTSAAKQSGVPADKLVVPFVDNQECIAME